MSEMLIIKAKVKDFAPGFNVAGDVADELDKKAKEMMKKACERARENNRKTVMAKDL
ncbi:MAG: DUF1931 domain-containing protein [Nanobdellota archaeon]